MQAITAEEPKPKLFSNRYFRNLILGSTVSMFGDQFYLVALPWLVLQLTGSSVALGTALMLAAFPRALLMLMGGAMSDRTSPRRVLLMTASARTVLVAAIAVLGWLKVLDLWHVYILAFAFGVADAFAIPALQALLPVLVPREQLTQANSVFQSSMQLTMITGPAPAGIVIKKLGTMWAFFIDAISFLFIIAPLSVIPDPPKLAQHQSPRSVWHTMIEGVKYVHRDATMRTLIFFGMALNFCIMGPIMVGLAAIAKNRFNSPTAYGIMFSAFAFGALAGSLAAGLRKQRRRGIMLLFVGSILGILLAIVGLVHTLVGMCVVMLLMGVTSGYSNVHMTAWYQERVESSMMGRVMSVRMFTIFGLMPISLAISGFVADISLKFLFVASGILMFTVTLLAAMQRQVREID
ncbi:MAG TPA: MFS transporter [Acidobacteriota bacterium]|nr:MFS transporter [Acidobacteriota bacterium]